MGAMKPKNIILYLVIILVLYAGQGIGRRALAQNSSSGAADLKLQRSVAIYNFKTTAESGPLRGEEIY